MIKEFLLKEVAPTGRNAIIFWTLTTLCAVGGTVAGAKLANKYLPPPTIRIFEIDTD